jgi:WD40 repeat protein
VRLWEASTGRPLATLQGNAGAVYCVGLSADGQLVASGGPDGTMRLWEASTGRLRATLQHAGGVWGVGLAAHGQLVGQRRWGRGSAPVGGH